MTPRLDRPAGKPLKAIPRTARSVRTKSEPRRTQQQRRDATRQKLLEAAVRCIAELGYHGATMDSIVARAGLSRGAQMHHFPTKQDFAVATYEYLLGNLAEQLRTQTRKILDEGDEASTLFEYLWKKYYSGDLFAVSMELALTSRFERSMRPPLLELTDRFHRSVDECWLLLCREKKIDEESTLRLLNMTMSLLRGMAVQTVLWNRAEPLHQQLEQWLKLTRL